MGRGSRAIAYLLPALMVLVADCSPTCVRGDLTKTPNGAVLAIVAPWSYDAKVCHVGHYLVAAPADGSEAGLIVSANRHPVLMISKGADGAEFDIFSKPDPRGDALPALSLQDRDGDGTFDFVSYATRDAAGHPTGTVTDGDLDGEADYRLLPNGADALARMNSEWCPLRSGKQGQEAFVNGKWGRARQDGKWHWTLVK